MEIALSVNQSLVAALVKPPEVKKHEDVLADAPSASRGGFSEDEMKTYMKIALIMKRRCGSESLLGDVLRDGSDESPFKKKKDN